jgi:predicted ATPase
MLERLDIRNYRSCLHTSVALQPDLSVLIGPNGSGKTNVLHAILLLKKLSDERIDFMARESQSDSESIYESLFDTTFRVDGKRARLETKLLLDTDDNNADVILRASQTWHAKEFTGSSKHINVPLGLAYAFTNKESPYHMYLQSAAGLRIKLSSVPHMEVPESFIRPLGVIADYVSNMKYYSASQFTNPSHCPVSFEIEKEGQVGRGRRIGGHAKFLADLYGEYKANSKSSYRQYFDVIGPNGIGLIHNIDFKEFPTSSVDYTVHSGGRIRQRKREKILIIPKFTIGRNELSPNQLSEGTFKAITLLFYVMTEKSSALLIEEPEVCVHHGLLSSIVELIKTYSKQKQIILSTHSDFVLDKLDVRHVYKVSRSDEAGTIVNHIADVMSPDELGALKSYLETEGNLGEYWKHGGLEEIN